MSVENTDRPSGAWATPARTNRHADGPPRPTSTPSTSTSPALGATSPLATRARVVLPAPLAPTRATASLAPTASDTPNSARNGP